MRKLANGPGEYAGVVYSSSRYLSGSRETFSKDTEEIVVVSKFETQPAIIHRGYGLTLNLGNYESARFDVSVTLPCYVEDIEAADEFAKAFVKARIEKEVEDLRGPKKVEGAVKKDPGSPHW